MGSRGEFDQAPAWTGGEADQSARDDKADVKDSEADATEIKSEQPFEANGNFVIGPGCRGMERSRGNK